MRHADRGGGENNLLPIGIQSLFTINSKSYNTRQSGEFNQKYVRTTMKYMTKQASLELLNVIFSYKMQMRCQERQNVGILAW